MQPAAPLAREQNSSCRLAGGLAWLVLLVALAGVVFSASADDEDFEVPGSQPTDSGHPVPLVIDHEFTGASVGSGSCVSCHSQEMDGSPFGPWRGSMMGNSARDPLFWAQLDLVNYDHNYRPQVKGMGDLCLRCHSPSAWLEGRSKDETVDPPGDNESDGRFSGMLFDQKDMDGVQCHVCHRMVDPLLDGENEIGDVANILDPLDAEGLRPPSYGMAMFVMDPKQTRRGPYAGNEMSGHGNHVPDDIAWGDVTDGVWDHPTAQSDFHRSSQICATCHDVSNPSDLPDDGVTTKGHAQQAFPIERTWTEWRHSAFYDPTVEGGGEENNCQSCHMSGPLNSTSYGEICFGSNEHLNDLHFHDMTGGNRWIPMVLKDMSTRWSSEDSNFVSAMKELYPQTDDDMFMGIESGEVAAWQTALDDTVERAERSLRRSAYLEVISDDADSDGSGQADLALRLINRTGHKLPTGYPEGRRMWLNVVFRDSAGGHLGESGFYDADEATLYHDVNLDGLNHDDASVEGDPESYDTIQYTDDTGTSLGEGRPTKIWSAHAHFDASESPDNDQSLDGKEFHFALVNHLDWDNRIPPEGWSIAGYTDNRAMPDTDIDEADAADIYEVNGWQSDYGVAAANPVHYDDFSYDYPSAGATDRVELTLYYQTSSREFIEALSDDNPDSLTSNGYNRGSLLLESWQRTLDHPVHDEDLGQSSPVEMLRVVHAVEDSDGDGLSDGWEAQYFVGICAGSDAYNDDPDGDGFNNWQEFQNGTDPCSAEEGHLPRPGVDIVLVLDMSGSMSSAAPNSSSSKLSVLKESVELFLDTWKDYAVPDDRLAVVYFSSTVTEFEPVGLPAPLENAGPVAFSEYWEEALADVQSQTAGGLTAMGGGLYYALNGFYPDNASGEANNRHIILFSNGMQNMSPMVSQPAEGELAIENLAPGADGVVGVSNIVADPSPFDAIVDDVSIHTIGIGVSGSNSGGDSWHELIANIAEETDGKHNFVTDVFEMEGTFLGDLVEALKGNTLEYVFEEEVLVSGGAPTRVEIPINQSASRMSVIVSWSDEHSTALDTNLIAPDGTVDLLTQTAREGSFYRIITRYLDDPDLHPEDYGTWTLELSSRGDGHSSLAHVHVLVDDTSLKYRFSAPSSLQAGQPLRVSMTALEGGRILRRIDEASVVVESPPQSLANLLSESRASLDTGELSGYDADLVATPYSQKWIAFLESQPTGGGGNFPETGTYDLLESTPRSNGLATQGVFTDTLLRADVPGHYKLHFRMVGHTLTGEHFERNEVRSVFVQTRPISGPLSRVVVATGRTGDILLVTPMDDRGNLLGPGHASRIEMQTISGHRLAVEDLLNGSYAGDLREVGSTTDFRVWIRGKLIHDGPIGPDTSSPLSVGSVDQLAGSEAGGSVLNITGTGFLPGASVSFGGVAATEVTVVSENLIQVTVPQGTGNVTLEVANPGGESSAANETFAYQPVGTTPSNGLPVLFGFGMGGGPLSGMAEPDSEVAVYLDDVRIATLLSNSTGAFSGPSENPVPFENREYVFRAESSDLDGNALGSNTYILNTFVGRNVERSSEGRDTATSALQLTGGASQTFRFIARPGDIEVLLYAKLIGNVTPSFVVAGKNIPGKGLDSSGGPDASGWRLYSAVVTVPDDDSSSVLTLSVSTPLDTPADAIVLVDEVAIAEIE